MQIKTLATTRRLDLGLTQSEVINIIGISKGTIVNWELNQKVPKVRYIPRIIDFLGYLPFSLSDVLNKPLGKRYFFYSSSMESVREHSPKR